MWRRYLRRAAAESCAPRRNWRWTLSSLFIGAGFGLIGGLHRLGDGPASVTPDVAMTSARAALVFFVVAWLAVVTVRFGRSLWARNKSRRLDRSAEGA
jgi:hypothetical protein